MNWHETATGVWSATIGEPETLTPRSVVAAAPRHEALQALGDVPLPFRKEEIVTERVSEKTVIRLPLASDERLFGLGLQFQRVNHRGRTRFLRVNSDPKQDTGETHAPVPFYVSSRGYGVLANTSRIVTIYGGSSVRGDSRTPPVVRNRGRDADWVATPLSEAVEIVVGGGGGVELFLFAGPTILEAVRRYNLYHGGGVLPPRWGLGFWHRVHYKYNAEQAKNEAREFRQRGFPCDVIGLEPGWHSRSYPTSFEWDGERFPAPQAFVEEMRRDGFHVNLWENPYVSPDARIHAPLTPLSGSHTVWGGLAPDFSLAPVREIVQQQHEEDHVSIGVSGYKLDECDGSELTGNAWMFPAHATFPSGHDGEQLRQVYGLLLQKLTGDLFRKHNRRTYGLVRASNAAASSLPYVLYSDLYDHRQFVRALCNASFSGLLWTPELRNARTAEDWVRRLQVVCFSPLAMLNAWASSTKPWSFPEVEPIVRKYLELRMRLMPYFYAAFARYHFDGTPPFRAMALEAGVGTARAASTSADLTLDAYGNAQDLDIGDQYLAGDSLLVAPLFAGETERKVLLPPGAWYEFETGERYEGGETITVAPGLERIPVFVREGGIIPLMPALPHAPQAGETVALEVRHYGRLPGAFSLFDDDGETYDFERGAFRWRELWVEIAPDGTRNGSITPIEAGWHSAYGDVNWEFIS